jgi:non-specific serine/threonine protein kinase
VAEICRRLDGLPLALELAAARTVVLSPAALRQRLEPRLPRLTGGPRDHPARLRTMRDAIAWSSDLLGVGERRLLRVLAVFPGGFSLEGAEWVDAALAVRGATPSTIDALATLVASSLLQRDAAPGEPRFTMLETVREFALDQLQATGEEAAARAAHAAFMLDLIERAQPELWAAASADLLDRLEREHDNLRAALGWAIAHDPETGLRLASGLAPFWSKRAHWVEGRAWLKRALTAGHGAATAARAATLGRAGAFAGDQGDFDEATRYLEESLTLAERLGDAQTAARSLRGLGILASNRSEFAAAETLFAAALERFRDLGDDPGIARCLNDLGLVAERQGDHDRAIAFQEEALPIARATGDDWQVGIILGNLGGAYFDRGEFARGEALSEESLSLSRQLGDTFGVAVNLYNLGCGALRRGEWVAALERFRETLQLTRELDELHLASRALDRVGAALHLAGSPRQAARLFGAAAALRESTGDTLFAEEDADLARRFAAVREALGDDVDDALRESGRTLPFDRALAEAIALAEAALADVQPGAAPELAGLTRRERDVLRLLADGRTDKEIADALFISPRTASSHVSAILAKLGVETRTAAVALALRRATA